MRGACWPRTATWLASRAAPWWAHGRAMKGVRVAAGATVRVWRPAADRHPTTFSHPLEAGVPWTTSKEHPMQRQELAAIAAERLMSPRMASLAKARPGPAANTGRQRRRLGERGRQPDPATEGLAHILNVALAPRQACRVALGSASGATAPAANWGAASPPAVASEIVSRAGWPATAATRPVDPGEHEHRQH